MNRADAKQTFTGPSFAWISERVIKGKFDISEHIIRMLTFGRLTMRELEASILNGTIVAFRRNQLNHPGSMVRGQGGAKQITTVCAGSGSQYMTILLAYLAPLPGWECEPEIHAAEDPATMNETTRQCFFCGGEVVPVVVGNFDYRLDGQLYVIKNVPAGLCRECGEKFITRDAAGQIDDRIASGRFDGTDTVRVIGFTTEEMPMRQE